MDRQEQKMVRVSNHWHYNLKLLAIQERKPISKMLSQIFKEHFNFNHLKQVKYEKRVIKDGDEESTQILK
jgi:hypothetical protein